MQTVAISEFKARCLQFLHDLQERGDEIIVTKRGRPCARVLPIGGGRRSARGILKGRAAVRGDVVGVDWTKEWEASR